MAKKIDPEAIKAFANLVKEAATATTEFINTYDSKKAKDITAPNVGVSENVVSLPIQQPVDKVPAKNWHRTVQLRLNYLTERLNEETDPEVKLCLRQRISELVETIVPALKEEIASEC